MATILLIDDDPRLRGMVRKALEGAGHEVREARNGREGVQAYEESPADVVLCDLFMPEQDGLWTIQELRRRNPQVKIVAMSGGSSLVPGNFLKLASLLGAARTLEKPFGIAEMLQTITDSLNDG